MTHETLVGIQKATAALREEKKRRDLALKFDRLHHLNKTSPDFPDSVIATPCTKITNSYNLHTRHGVVKMTEQKPVIQ